MNTRKQEFLAVHDYGQGGAWARIIAENPAEIAAKYPFLVVVEQRPAWMNNDIYKRLESFDIEQPPTGWVATAVKEQK